MPGSVVLLGFRRRRKGPDELRGALDDLRVAAGAGAGVLGGAAVAVGEPGLHLLQAGEKEGGGLLDGMVLRRGLVCRGSLVGLVGFVGVCHEASV